MEEEDGEHDVENRACCDQGASARVEGLGFRVQARWEDTPNHVTLRYSERAWPPGKAPKPCSPQGARHVLSPREGPRPFCTAFLERAEGGRAGRIGGHIRAAVLEA